MSSSSKPVLRTLIRYLGVYGGWLVSAGLGGYALLKLWEAITQTFRVLFPHSWAYGAVHMFSIVILGVGWLLGILFLEDHYRAGVRLGRLGKRFLRVTLIECVILLGALALLLFVM